MADPGSDAGSCRLCFVGPHLGRHAGWVTTQSEVIAELFAAAGHQVVATSSVRSHLLRPLAMAWDLLRSRRRFELAVISVYSGRAFHSADIASRVARLLGVPQVQWLHGGGFPELAASKPAWVRRVLARADVVVTPSPFLARAAAELGFEAEVIPNVLDLEASPFHCRQHVGEPIELLWVRTFHELYRPLLALEVLRELLARGVDARLTLAGQDKGLLAACRQRSVHLGLGSRVTFPGFLDAAGKRREFRRHDIYLHTNKVDNMPVTVLEAAAFGLPIVAAAVGGVPDLLEHESTALLVDDGEQDRMAEQMAEAVVRLLEQPALTLALSRQGRRLAEQSAWPRIRERWLQVFRKVL